MPFIRKLTPDTSPISTPPGSPTATSFGRPGSLTLSAPRSLADELEVASQGRVDEGYALSSMARGNASMVTIALEPHDHAEANSMSSSYTTESDVGAPAVAASTSTSRLQRIGKLLSGPVAAAASLVGIAVCVANAGAALVVTFGAIGAAGVFGVGMGVGTLFHKLFGRSSGAAAESTSESASSRPRKPRPVTSPKKPVRMPPPAQPPARKIAQLRREAEQQQKAFVNFQGVASANIESLREENSNYQDALSEMTMRYEKLGGMHRTALDELTALRKQLSQAHPLAEPAASAQAMEAKREALRIELRNAREALEQSQGMVGMLQHELVQAHGERKGLQTMLRTQAQRNASELEALRAERDDAVDAIRVARPRNGARKAVSFASDVEIFES